MQLRKVKIDTKEDLFRTKNILDNNNVKYKMEEDPNHLAVFLVPEHQVNLLGYEKQMLEAVPLSKGQKRRLRITQVVVGVLFGLIFITIIGICNAPSATEKVLSKPISEMTDAEYDIYLEENFGFGSEFTASYGAFVQQNYVNYPRTFRFEEVRIFPIDRDSLTHVFIFSAENAFGVRQDHSFTNVVNSRTGDVLRQVSSK
jgi:hypothetical protein